MGRQSVPDPVLVDGADTPLRGTGGSGCLARFSDRVLANRFIYHLRDPRRGEIIVFNVPDIAAEAACGAGGVFVKRIVGLPGDVWQEREGFVYINGKKLNEPYVKKDRRDFEFLARPEDPEGQLLHDGRQPPVVLRLAASGGRCRATEHHRQGLLDLLASQRIRLM